MTGWIERILVQLRQSPPPTGTAIRDGQLMNVRGYQRLLTECLAVSARLGHMGAQPLTYALAALLDHEFALQSGTASMTDHMMVITLASDTYNDALRKLYPNAYAYEREVIK